MSTFDLKQFKKVIRYDYKSNFSILKTDPYFVELTPQLQSKVKTILLEGTMMEFKYFFSDPTLNQELSQATVIKILSHLSCEMIPEYEIVLHANDEVKNIYLIRSGFVQIFDRFYNFMSE